MNTQLIVMRYGELALKKRNRGRFEWQFAENVKASLCELGLKSVQRLSGRLLVEFNDDVPWKKAEHKIKKVFGFSTASPVQRTALHMADLETAVAGYARTLQFDSFAVRTKRSNKKFPLISPEISSHVGSAINIATGARIDLTNPERIFNIEVLNEEIFFSAEKIKGPGGLPTGISGRVAALLSGGIDSPVAAWRMMRRGLKVDFIHFHSKPFTDDASIEKVEEMAGKLSEWQCGAKLFLVPFGRLQKKIVTSVPSKYRVLLYRRFMMRLASKIAIEERAGALITGESLGQVASQTLSNLASVEAVSELPVFRPLIGMDKQEIVDLAKEIDTFDLSIEPHNDCCSFLQPPNPATKTTPRELDIAERGLDINTLLKEALSGVEKKHFFGNTPSDTATARSF